jgi:aryl-alcohol dehydrogenase-like predicted oxidoreductase
MKKRQLGKSDLFISSIGLGAWAMGGGNWAHGWGHQDDNDSISAIHRAIDLGINWIDTAPAYGVGHSEKVVGRAIKCIRKRVIIATKCMPWIKEKGESVKQSIYKQAEASIRRLQVDEIDLYQIHWPWPNIKDVEEAWYAIVSLIKEGKVRYGGVSNFNIKQMEQLKSIHPIASTQPPYSMLDREIEEEILPYCKKQNIGIISYSPLKYGLLSGKMSLERITNLPETDWRKGIVSAESEWAQKQLLLFREPGLSLNLKLVEGLRDIAGRYDKTPAQLAISWVLRRAEITAAITGVRRPSQIEETAYASDWDLNSEVLREIEQLLIERKRALSFYNYGQ